MTNPADPLVICPSCHAPKPTSECKKIVSRSSGKTSTSIRCLACIKRKEVAIQEAKARAKILR